MSVYAPRWFRGRHGAPVVEAPYDAEDVCCICLEPIDDAKKVLLRCAHAFHGQCLCDHLVYDARCPLCRDTPGDDEPSSSYESDDELNQTPELTFDEAWQRAYVASQNDKRTDKMFQTFKKWKQAHKELGKTLRQYDYQLRPLEKAFVDKIEEYEKKERVKFDKKNAKILQSREDAAKARRKAVTHARASQYRIAKKFGFVRPHGRGATAR